MYCNFVYTKNLGASDTLLKITCRFSIYSAGTLKICIQLPCNEVLAPSKVSYLIKDRSEYHTLDIKLYLSTFI